MNTSVCAIICAAGKGVRAGFEKNKLLLPLEGKRVLEKTLSAFDFPAIDEIIVTSSDRDFAEITSLLHGRLVRVCPLLWRTHSLRRQ